MCIVIKIYTVNIVLVISISSNTFNSILEMYLTELNILFGKSREKKGIKEDNGERLKNTGEGQKRLTNQK